MRKGRYTEEQILLHLFRDSVRFISTDRERFRLAEEAERILGLEKDDTTLDHLASQVNNILRRPE